MIKFECREGSISTAMFMGDMNTIVAELCLQVGLVYSAFYEKDKSAASAFKHRLLSALVDADTQNAIFNHDFVKKALGDDAEEADIAFGDPEEFARQLREIMEGRADEGE